MIPPIVSLDNPSRGEIEIYHRLRDDPATANWTVLHSLNVANHRSQVEGEIDFVIIVPGKGVVCLEVKSSRHIRRQDGMWYFGSASSGDIRGPFRQASEAMHSLRQHLVQRRPDLSRVVFWTAVAFPYSRFSESSTEWHSWQVINTQSFTARPIGSLIESILIHARTHLSATPSARWFHPTSSEPYVEQCEEIATLLRGNFEYFESPRTILQQQNEEVRRYTDEQLRALEAMESNPRVVFAGPAGTGKTVLAIESARRAIREGRRPLLLCFNRLLGNWLYDQTRDLGPSLETTTLHQLLLRVADMSVDDDADRDFWQAELPLRAVDQLLETPNDKWTFDELIVDEAQDILRSDYLDVLDLMVKGGLAAGRWRMYGDFDKQTIYDASDLDVDRFLASRGSSAPIYQLRNNCRNTPRIAHWVQHLGGLDPAYSRILRQDDQVDPSIRFYRTPTDQQSIVEAELQQLYDSGFRGDDIVILSPRTCCVASAITRPPWGSRLRPLANASQGNIGYCTIQAFKGLEAPAVLVTDIEHIRDMVSASLFYVAISRALHRLVIVANERVKHEVQDLLVTRQSRD